MRDPLRWSVSLGRWGVVTVRLHVFFLIFIAATYYLCWQDASDTASGVLFPMVTAALGLLFLSVLVHEWSHFLVARRYAAPPSTLVVGPLGGVSDWGALAFRRGQTLCMLAGPAANLVLCGVSATALLTLSHAWEPRLLNPLEPVWTERAGSVAEQGLQLTLWINWLLLLVNLLPAYPFDGGRILGATLRAIWPQQDRKWIADIVFWCAVGVSGAVMLVALVLWKREAGSAIFPVSFALMLLSVVLLVSARRDLDNMINIDSPAVVDAEREEPWPLVGAAEPPDALTAGGESKAENAAADATGTSLEECWESPPPRDTRAPSLEQIEAQEEQQVDAILSRLHASGWSSLSTEERRLLHRVSARYRSRMGRHT